jgi:hypothetical protein
MAVENRNSKEKRPKTVWELMADEWNNPFFAPETEEIQGLHSNFSTTEALDHDLVSQMSPATPERCQRAVSSMIVELSRVIRNWEASGQGDGGVEEEEEEDERDVGDHDADGDNGRVGVAGDYGCLKHRSRGALDVRHSFVQSQQTYILYLWTIYKQESIG